MVLHLAVREGVHQNQLFRQSLNNEYLHPVVDEHALEVQDTVDVRVEPSHLDLVDVSHIVSEVVQ